MGPLTFLKHFIRFTLSIVWKSQVSKFTRHDCWSIFTESADTLYNRLGVVYFNFSYRSYDNDTQKFNGFCLKLFLEIN